jgi:hypothetical protein
LCQFRQVLLAKEIRTSFLNHFILVSWVGLNPKRSNLCFSFLNFAILQIFSFFNPFHSNMTTTSKTFRQLIDTYLMLLLLRMCSFLINMGYNLLQNVNGFGLTLAYGSLEYLKIFNFQVTSLKTFFCFISGTLISTQSQVHITMVCRSIS